MFALAAAATLVGCGATAGEQTRGTDLGTVEIVAERGGATPRTWIRDREAVWQDAMARYDDEDWDEAARLLTVFEREFHDDPRRAEAHYKHGLALLASRRYDAAAQRLREAIVLARGTRAARDAVFYLADALLGGAKPLAAAEVYRAALDEPAVHGVMGGPLGLLDQLEAATRMGLALDRGGEPTQAIRALRRVDHLYRDNRDLRPVAESMWVVRAYFERGQIYERLFGTIHFKLPVSRMSREIEDKANLFFKAQSSYFKAVRLQHKRWSVAAGLHIGRLYSSFLDDMNNAEVPPDLDPYTLEVYREELWTYTRVLAKKAIRVLRKNLEMARRIGASGPWVAATEKELRRMEAFREAEEARSAAFKAKAAKTPPGGKAPSS